MKQFCKNQANDDMSTEDLHARIQKTKTVAMGLAVSAIGYFVGVTVGLSSSLGAGSAVGIGIGASSGLFVASYVTFKKANEMSASLQLPRDNIRDDDGTRVESSSSV
mmetsp:Transcript_43698/g.52916  ORF Transcript_43698/g.52916 Transcript_43698/m.52916 type:complete len:107 (+) Transcript_43698:138-458(+)